ncbi:MAG: DNA mismatch repair protein MutS [Planctomycetota bacterium]|nr:DNA mismatch repair protein MutS [Planctomycetota bacterium]
MPDPRETPAMQQYAAFKARHPGCVLLFRIGDFYEMFDDDAVRVSRAIGLTLTQRTEGVPMAGVPFHQLENYLRKMLAAGFRIAVADQIEDASSPAAKARGIIARDVTRVITPGTLVDESLLEDDAPAAVGAICFLAPGDDAPAALAIVEASTGAFLLADGPIDAARDELARSAVRELIFAETADGAAPPRVRRLAQGLGLSLTPRPAWHFRVDEARRTLLGHYRVATLEGFGLRDDDPAIPAAGAVLAYVVQTQSGSDPESASAKPESRAKPGGSGQPRASLAHLRPPRRREADARLVLDAVTLRSLEVERTIRGPADATGDASLLGVMLGNSMQAGAVSRSGASRPLGKTCRTPMGRRLLREWLVAPSCNQAEIHARHNAVAILASDERWRDGLVALLEPVQDVTRILARTTLGRATPRDVVALGRALAQAPKLSECVAGSPALARLHALLSPSARACEPLGVSIASRCVETPPLHLREGGLFRDGIDAELDECRLLQRDAGAWLAEYQSRIAEQLRLPGIKVGFNRVFGYYIELSAAQAKGAEVGALLRRKQTLKNAERYTTPELQEFEQKVTTAEARGVEREQALFRTLCQEIIDLAPAISSLGDAIAELDVLVGFALHAVRWRWIRPEIVADPVLSIQGGRHPVLEQSLGSDFVPNDLSLGSRPLAGPAAIQSEGEPPIGEPGVELEPAPPLALITGPNMAGKSTFIRQIALIVLLAHAGSFVPAERAIVGLCDRIFTRVGADDALHAGQSTFMVEMTETANILNNATPRSLVVLDEVGRGTSTLDGLSLAWAIVEKLAGLSASSARPAAPRTLFATHYHELTQLQDRHPDQVANLHVEVREWPPGDPGAELVFMHRIKPGRSDRSYGLHVARLAGVPREVVERADAVLRSLSVEHEASGPTARGTQPDNPHQQDAHQPDPGQADGHVPGPPAGGRARASRKLNTANIPQAGAQLALFTEYVAHPAVDQLRDVKLEALSPMQAFDMLRRLRELVTNDP